MYQNIYVEKAQDGVNKVVHLWDDEVGYKKFEFRPYAYTKNDFGEMETIYGDRVSKVESWTSEDIKHNQIFESDVPIQTRILVDIYYESDDVSKGHRLVPFDIEVDTTDGLPNVNYADSEITSISFYDSVADEYFVFVLDKNNEVKQSKIDNEYVVPFDNEADLLNAFIIKWQEISPTITTGWNIDGFDIPYLYRRMTKVIGKYRADCLSPINKVYYSNYKNRYYIAGISCLDYLPLYKLFRKMSGRPELPSYSLDAVAKEELKKGKVEYDGSLDKLMKEDIEKFIEYNLVDTKLVVEIDQKAQLIEAVRGICHKGHVPYEEMYASSRWIEGAMLVYCKRHGLVAPNKDQENKNKMDEDDKFAGAYVKVPESSKYEWIYDLDFTSLYPSIIISLNISPETKVGKIDGWNAERFMNNKDMQYYADVLGSPTEMTGEELQDLIDKYHFSVSSNGVLYRHDKKGLIPQILDEWFKDKNKYDKKMKQYGNEGDEEKEKYYKARRTIAKVMLNSVYGVLGLPVFRFYDVDNAEAVTLTGQRLIQYTEKMANHYYSTITGEEKDYCIYIDTDSVFFPAEPLVNKLYPQVDVSDNDQMASSILRVTTQVQDFLNQSFDLFSKQFLHLKNHRFDVKQEVIARAGLWTVKKRYALWIINDSGVSKDEVMYKGLDVIRSSFPESFRTFLKDLLNDILKKDTKTDEAKSEINERVINFQNKVKTISLEDIASPTSVKGLVKYKYKGNTYGASLGSFVKGAPAHVKAALSYNELLKMWKLDKHFSPIQEGEKIKWVYLKSNDLGIDALAFRGYEDPKDIIEFIEKNLDRDKMTERVLNKKLQDFYDAVGWQVPSKQQEKVNKWFGDI